MTTDLIALAEAALESDCQDSALAVFVPPLIAALKAAEAENEQRPDRKFVDDYGRRWEWCGGTEGTWAWRVTARPHSCNTPYGPKCWCEL